MTSCSTISLFTSISSSSLIEAWRSFFRKQESTWEDHGIWGLENSRNELCIAEADSIESPSVFNVIERIQQLCCFALLIKRWISRWYFYRPSGSAFILRIRARMAEFIQTFRCFWDFDLSTRQRFRESTMQNSMSLHKSCEEIDSGSMTWRRFAEDSSNKVPNSSETFLMLHTLSGNSLSCTDFNFSRFENVILRDTIIRKWSESNKLQVLQASRYSIALSGMMQRSRILRLRFCRWNVILTIWNIPSWLWMKSSMIFPQCLT